MSREFNNSPINFKSTEEDSLKGRCGEIFVTLRRTLAFHCTLCTSKQGSFGCFLEHLSSHFKEIYIEGTSSGGLSYIVGDVADTLSENFYDHEELPGTEDSDWNTHNREEPIYSKLEVDSDQNKRSQEESTCSNEQIEVHREDQDLLTKEDADLDEVSFDFDILQDEDLLVRQALVEEIPYPKPRSNREKPGLYTCEICNKAFNYKTGLTKHRAIHSKERKHKCNLCGFAFKDSSSLATHLRRRSCQKEFNCNLCSRKFHTHTKAERHMRTHNGEKTYDCSYCGVIFPASSALKVHEKRHAEEPAFICNYCNKPFWKALSLAKHIILHKKEELFSCPVCSVRFPRLKSLLQHKALHH